MQSHMVKVSKYARGFLKRRFHTVLWAHCPCKKCLWQQSEMYDKSGCLRSVDREFQTRGQAALKVLSPKFVGIRLPRIIRLSAEQSTHPDSTRWTRQSLSSFKTHDTQTFNAISQTIRYKNAEICGASKRWSYFKNTNQ